jgi:uncharacterized protein (TIGR02996 family)
MHEENGFIHKLLEYPADETTRLVYADWLDERGDAASKKKSEFLRETVKLGRPLENRPAIRKLQRLAAGLDPQWLAVVSKLAVENCGAKRADGDLWQWLDRQFDFVCDKRWDELTCTKEPAVRHCQDCQQKVYYCRTIGEAQERAAYSQCVAVDLGVIRRDGDLQRIFRMGRISRRDLHREENG